MKFEDDTPSRGETPRIYPREPPRSLLSSNQLRPNNLFAFEGLDASGKSTVVDQTARALRSEGRDVVTIKLGGSEVVRHAMERAKWLNADPMTFSLLNWVSLYEQMVALREHYDSEKVILVDRYVLTVIARGSLEGLDPTFMQPLQRALPQPTATFLIHCDPAQCLARVESSGRCISYVSDASSPFLKAESADAIVAV